MNRISLLAVLFALSCPLLWADDAAVWETKGDRALAQGKSEAAVSHFEKALLAQLKEAKTTKGKERYRSYGHATYYLIKLYSLTRSNFLYRRLATFLDPLLSRPNLEPQFKSHLQWIRLHTAHRLNETKVMAQLRRDLGFIQHWAVIGAFDNDRGGAFQVAYPPEKIIALKGRYKGKKRNVGWRFVPVSSPVGTVNLNAMFSPNDQVLAYGLTYVHSPQSQPAALRLAGDEGFKVWVNNRLVRERDIHRASTFDQDVIGVRLNKGWNKILLKITERTGDWDFLFRITRPDGRPLTGLKTIRSLSQCQSIQVAKGSDEVVKVPPTAIEALTEAAPRDKTGRTYFHLGYLHGSLQIDDEKKYRAREAWKKALACQPQSAHYLFYYSQVVSGKTRYSVEKEENQRRFALEKALSAEPQNPRVLYELARYYYFSMRNWHKARQFNDRALKINPQYQRARQLQIRIFRSMDWNTESSIKFYQVASMDKVKDLPPFLDFRANQHLRRGDHQKALALWKQALAIDYHYESVRDNLVEYFRNQGDMAKAIEWQRQLVEIDPYSVSGHRKLAALYQGLDDFAGAAKELEKALKINPEDDSLWADLARCEMRLGRNKLALSHLERALQVNPNNVKIRKYIQFFKRNQKSFEDDFSTDVPALVKKARKTKYSSDAPVHVLVDKSVIKVYPDGTSSQFGHFTAVITNEQGARQYDYYPMSYYAGEQRVEVKEARVYKADGTVEEAQTGKASSSYGGGEFAGWRRTGVSLPSLKVGDIIDVQYRVDDLKQNFFGNYFGTTFYFQDQNPMDLSQLVLIVPTGLPLHFNYRGEKISPEIKKNKDGTTTYIWTRRNTPKIESEPAMPSTEEIYPSVEISTFANWKEFGRWYWNLIKKQFESSDELKAKVAALVKGKKTEREKVRAVYNYVVSEIRYSSEWEFGVHGFKPYSAAAIYARKFGDCKDKATLIATMLGEVGIKAYPVLINGVDRRSKEDISLPMVSHFNHCIAYVPAQKGIPKGIFLDGTAEHHSMDTLPTMNWGAKVVVCRPDGAVVKQIPYPAATANQYRGKYRFQIQTKGGAQVHGTFEAKKEFGVLHRYLFHNKGRQKKNLTSLWGRYFGGSSVKKWKFSDMSDLNRAVRGSYTIQIPRFLNKQGQKYQIPRIRNRFFENSFGDKLTDLAGKSERKYDLLLPVPTSLDMTYEFVLPSGFQITNLPSSKKIDFPFGSYLYEAQLKGNVIRVRKVLTIKKPRVPVEAYPKFRKFCNQVERAESERITIAPRRQDQ